MDMSVFFVIFTLVIVGIFATFAILDTMRLLACGMMALCFAVLGGG